MAGETLCLKPIPPAAVNAEAAAKEHPGLATLFLKIAGTKHPAKQRQGLPVGARILGGRDSRGPDSLRTPLPPEGGWRVDPDPVDRQPPLWDQCPESISPPPSRRPTSPRYSSPGIQLGPSRQEETGGPGAGGSASPARLATLAPRLGEVIKKKKFSSPSGGTGRVLLAPRPQPPPNSLRSPRGPSARQCRARGTPEGWERRSGREVLLRGIRGVPWRSEIKKQNHPRSGTLPSASPCRCLRWATRPKLFPASHPRLRPLLHAAA